MTITLHIERLIVDGLNVAPHQRARLQAAVETELARLLAEGGLAPALSGGGALPGVRASEMPLTGSTDPGHVGRQIARAVYGGLGQ